MKHLFRAIGEVNDGRHAPSDTPCHSLIEWNIRSFLKCLFHIWGARSAPVFQDGLNMSARRGWLPHEMAQPSDRASSADPPSTCRSLPARPCRLLVMKRMPAAASFTSAVAGIGVNCRVTVRLPSRRRQSDVFRDIDVEGQEKLSGHFGRAALYRLDHLGDKVARQPLDWLCDHHGDDVVGKCRA